MQQSNLHDILEQNYLKYCQKDFIKDDPISIPHRFSQKQDIEIAAFLAATIAWGKRTMIINSCNKIMKFMDNSPHDFILHHSDKDLKPFEDFCHRTFQPTDILYFIDFLKRHYTNNDSLESAFSRHLSPTDTNIEKALTGFHNYFFDAEYAPQRTKKHVATPARKSACKRINMFLRWMVRKDSHGVDFGIWENISSSQLICPLDIHVERVGKKLGILTRKPTDWKAAVELTNVLKSYDSKDPVKYDFALFGLGIEGFATEQA